MGADPRIVILGEDVHKLSGGTNGATKGLPKKYPGRVLGTPISENAFAGLGGGLALDGRFRPVVEFMYPDFLWVAADQVFNQIGKARHMFGGRNPVPLVLRTKVAMGSGYGSQHLMDPAGIFATSPGWRIMAASTPFDYVGLMNAALAVDDPVLMLEHVDLYGTEGEIPVDDLDYQIPFGKAAVRRAGSEVTVLSYLSMVARAAEAIERTGIDAELIDLRFLDRASLDWETVGASVRKTNAVLIVEQGSLGTSYGGWLADEIQRRFFDWLDQPVQRVTGAESSPSISRVLEQSAIATTDDVVAGLERVRDGFGKVQRLMAVVVRMPSVLAGATEAALAHWLVAPGDNVERRDARSRSLRPRRRWSSTRPRRPASSGGSCSAKATLARSGTRSPSLSLRARPTRTSMRPSASKRSTSATPTSMTTSQEPASPALSRTAPAVPAGSAERAPVAAAAPANGHLAAGRGGRVFASPLVRKLAGERGVDLAGLAGTGPNGRIVRRDLERFLAAARAPQAPDGPGPGSMPTGPMPTGTGPGRPRWPVRDRGHGGGEAEHAPVRDDAVTAQARGGSAGAPAGATLIPHTPMRRAIARRLTESKATRAALLPGGRLRGG